MDIWFDEWLDSESARLRANEEREVRRRRTLANWRAIRFWQGRKWNEIPYKIVWFIDSRHSCYGASSLASM